MDPAVDAIVEAECALGGHEHGAAVEDVAAAGSLAGGREKVRGLLWLSPKNTPSTRTILLHRAGDLVQLSDHAGRWALGGRGSAGEVDYRCSCR
jgi:hypothetical protein